MAERYAWQAVIEALETEEVPLLFGIPGDPRFLYDALYDSTRTKAVLVREETSGVFMAIAFARLTGKPTVCFGSPGPGVANLIPGLMEASAACAPVIALASTASTRYEGLGAFQEVDQLALVEPVTKWSTRVTYPEQVPWVMRRAFSLATSGKPGPVYVEIPADVALQRVEIPRYVPCPRPLRPASDPEAIEAAADLLAQAERPLLVAGGGVILSGAQPELKELAEMRGVPVVTTPSGRGSLPEDHSLALGLVGLYFSKVGEKAYADADLLITIGSRNEEFQTGRWQYFPPGARFIQIDIDSFEIGRNWVPDVAVVSDAKLALRELVAALKRRGPAQPWDKAWCEELSRQKMAYAAEVEVDCDTDAVPIKSKRVVKEVNRVFGGDAILVNENGGQDLWSYYSPYYQVTTGGHCVPPGEQTCMGIGVAGAIGAKLAMPEKRVVCVTGDGAFQMFMKELPTAVQYAAPVTWIVLNTDS
ncbi:MAG: thiamine pyrophosphate-binding protein, partial [Dehalococcoidia bacterium]